MSRLGLDGELAAEQLDTLLDPQQAEARTPSGALAGYPWVEANTVVADDQSDLRVALLQLDPDLSRPCVPHHVGQRLLDHTEAGGGQVGVHGVTRQLVDEMPDEAGSLGLAIDQPSQRGCQAEVVEY